MTYNALVLKSKVIQCPMVARMSRCFCVRLDDEVELILDVDAAEYHLLKDEPINDNYRTPLHWAAAMGQTQAVTSLLELNANPNPIDLEQGTPLDYARQSGHTDCVQILEERLGLRGGSGGIIDSVVPTGSHSANHNTSPPTKANRKGPLGFIADLFKPKRSNRPNNENIENANNEAIGDSYANNNIRATNGGGGTPRSERLSTPKKLRDPDMLISMEKLQVSREDNPAVSSGRGGPAGDRKGAGRKDPGYELGDIQPSHSQNVPLGAAGRSVLLPSVNKTNLDHSHLIRSPPPTLKQRGGSPVGGVWNTEKDHEKLEEDAATILALQRDVNLRTPVGAGLPGLSSLNRGAELHGRRAVTMTPSAVAGGGYTSISPGGESVSSTRSHPAQLAPLKGPVPPSPRITPTNPIVHKRLEGLRAEPPPPSRTPTPPPPIPLATPRRDSVPLNSSSGNRCNSIDGPSANPQRKKKKKKKAVPADLMEASASNRKLGDPYLDAAEQLVPRRGFEGAILGPPRLQASPLGQGAKH